MNEENEQALIAANRNNDAARSQTLPDVVYISKQMRDTLGIKGATTLKGFADLYLRYLVIK